jgi:GAF domain-containing protein
MTSYPLPSDEPERLKALDDLNIMYSLSEEVYDDITLLATEICGTPISLLTIVGEKRQFHKSKQGLEVEDIPREQSFCSYAILDPNEVFVVEDARFDERFRNNPLTTGYPNIIFYAGVPVVDPNGFPMGAICVIDNRPRELSDQKIASLKALAKVVNAHFELRKHSADLVRSQGSLQVVRSLVSSLKQDMENSAQNDPRPTDADHMASLLQIEEVIHIALEGPEQS